MTTNHQTQSRSTILIPTPLRKYTDGQSSVNVDGATVGEALRDLARQYPVLEQHLYDEAGRLRSFVNVYLDDEDIRYLDQENTALAPAATLSIVPSIAGG